MLVREHCTKDVVCIRSDAPIIQAVRKMRREGVGSVVVLDADGKAVGIVTDRDLALRVVAVCEDQDREAPVSQVMSSPLVHADPDETLEQAVRRMCTRGLRRLPVCEAGRPLGMLALDDVLAVIATCLFDIAAEAGAQRQRALWRGHAEAAREELEELYEDVRDRLRYTTWYSRARLLDEIDTLKDKFKRSRR